MLVRDIEYYLLSRHVFMQCQILQVSTEPGDRLSFPNTTLQYNSALARVVYSTSRGASAPDGADAYIKGSGPGQPWLDKN